ncbi:MAG: sensor domain-containing diguanylate cyclase [Deltaproteobacteria bacterium]
MAESTEGQEITGLKARIAALEQLLKVKESAVKQQTSKVEAALAEAEKWRGHYELLLNSTWEGILGLDLEGNHQFVNPAAARMLGYTVEELMGRHSHDTWHRHRRDGKTCLLEECPIHAAIMAGRVRHGANEVFWKKDGTGFPVKYNCTPLVQGGNTRGAVVTFWDISETQRADEAQARSLVDELTGLYNRRGFFTLASHQFKLTKRRHQGMVLLFADLDGLKAINDTLGHLAGDQALIEVAGLMRRTFRESDILARIGGDEFVVLILEPTGVKSILRRLYQNLKRCNVRADRAFGIALSIGMAHFNPLFPSTIEELVCQADFSMYENKRRRQTSGA